MTTLRQAQDERIGYAVNVGLSKLSANLPEPCGRAVAFEFHANVQAVCRAGRRGERNRCAVRMTVRGSAAPGMACRDRPVESSPQLGAFPAVGLYPAAGLLRTAASVLNPPPPSGSLANLPRCQGRTAPAIPIAQPIVMTQGCEPGLSAGCRRPPPAAPGCRRAPAPAEPTAKRRSLPDRCRARRPPRPGSR